MTLGDREISWEALNAYVDGELGAEMSARVAAAAAQDTALAVRIATLSKLKANVAIPEVSFAEAPPMPIGMSRGQTPWLKVAMAAGLALVLATGLLVQHRIMSKPAQTWLDIALMAQQQWLDTASRTGHDDHGLVKIDAATGTRPLDLSEAELTLVYAAPMSLLKQVNGTFLGYRGPHGCMVGLWVGAPQAGLEANPRAFDVKAVRVRAWADQTAGYALMAKGMDPARIDRLSTAVARLVDPAQIADDGVRTALRDAARTGVACRV